MKKRITSFVLVFAIVLTLTGTALAFNFYFNVDYIDNLNTSLDILYPTSSPYVYPTTITTKTTYYLTQYLDKFTVCSTAVETVGGSKSDLTYFNGYGKAGQLYRLTGYPTQLFNYEIYRTSGTFSA